MNETIHRGSIRAICIGLLAFFCSMISQSGLMAQNVVIHSIDIKDGEVRVSYSLIDRNLANRYALYLYSSLDNYENPLREVEGEIGLNLKAGNNKKLVWYASEEYGKRFKGDLSLKIKGSLYTPFMELTNFENIEIVKRKQPVWITWSADSTVTRLTMELYDENRKFVHTYTNIENEGRYKLVIPRSVRSGKGYYFMIFDQDNENNIVRTPRFEVIRKNRNALKVILISVGVLGVGGYFAYEYLFKDPEPAQPQTGFDDPVLPVN